jgi:hypothetical protein
MIDDLTWHTLKGTTPNENRDANCLSKALADAGDTKQLTMGYTVCRVGETCKPRIGHFNYPGESASVVEVTMQPVGTDGATTNTLIFNVDRDPAKNLLNGTGVDTFTFTSDTTGEFSANVRFQDNGSNETFTKQIFFMVIDDFGNFSKPAADSSSGGGCAADFGNKKDGTGLVLIGLAVVAMVVIGRSRQMRKVI